MRTFFFILVLIGLAAGGGAYYVQYVSASKPVEFRTALVQRGDLLPAIAATGVVQPEEVVEVGAQVAGRIIRFGPDLSDPEGKKTVDYRTIVQKGQVLAEIDPVVYQAQRDQAYASLLRAKADLLQLKAKLKQAEKVWQRAQNLLPDKAISETDYDLAEANYQTAQAAVEVGEATIKQNEAALKMAENNLAYTVIESPIQGEIITRSVNIGQTVVASLNAPRLFLIAKDLRRMQVRAAVNEADIGQIHPGMPVRFTVDAFPGETFRGEVIQIRYNATMTQNVVTYTVVVETDNSSGRLLPYLTANLQFELDRRENVLYTSNAALRWKPRTALIAPDVRETASSNGSGPSRGKSNDARDSAKSQIAKTREDRGRVWVADGPYVRPIEVQIGATDGVSTEIQGDGLTEGLEVVIGEVSASAAGGDPTNPFIPKLPPRGGRK